MHPHYYIHVFLSLFLGNNNARLLIRLVVHNRAVKQTTSKEPVMKQLDTI